MVSEIYLFENIFNIHFNLYLIVSSMQKMVNQLGSSTDSQELRNQL